MAKPIEIAPLTCKADDRALVTHSSLVRDLSRADVKAGDVILVHTSLSSLGFVVGAARTIIEALLEVVGDSGTVMMPTYSGELSDPAEWRHPPVPPDWIGVIREETQPYDPVLTPTRRMGAVAELFRHYPGVRRSPHPQSSFAAWGKMAGLLVDEHPLDYRFGPASPLGKLRELEGKSILLGAPPQTCSLYYLSQHFIGGAKQVSKSAPMMIEGKKEWVRYVDLEYPNQWFSHVTEHLLREEIISKHKIGDASCISSPSRETIDAVVEWRRQHGV